MGNGGRREREMEGMRKRKGKKRIGKVMEEEGKIKRGMKGVVRKG